MLIIGSSNWTVTHGVASGPHMSPFIAALANMYNLGASSTQVPFPLAGGGERNNPFRPGGVSQCLHRCLASALAGRSSTLGPHMGMQNVTSCAESEIVVWLLHVCLPLATRHCQALYLGAP
jgi:hypothetical protein